MVPVFAREYFKEGGYRSLPTVQDMYDIPLEKRKEGMLIRIIEEQVFYILEGGIQNENFSIITLGGGGGSINLSAYLKTTDAESKFYTKAQVDAAIKKAVEEALANVQGGGQPAAPVQDQQEDEDPGDGGLI